MANAAASFLLSTLISMPPERHLSNAFILIAPNLCIVADSGIVRYSIYSGDPNGYFSIDALSGTIRTSSGLDHETHPSVLLNVQAMSGDPPAYGHSQVRQAVNIFEHILTAKIHFQTKYV
jgi:Cadherin domain